MKCCQKKIRVFDIISCYIIICSYIIQHFIFSLQLTASKTVIFTIVSFFRDEVLSEKN